MRSLCLAAIVLGLTGASAFAWDCPPRKTVYEGAGGRRGNHPLLRRQPHPVEGRPGPDLPDQRRRRRDRQGGAAGERDRRAEDRVLHGRSFANCRRGRARRAADLRQPRLLADLPGLRAARKPPSFTERSLGLSSTEGRRGPPGGCASPNSMRLEKPLASQASGIFSIMSKCHFTVGLTLLANV